jgi:hypothetical protein
MARLFAALDHDWEALSATRTARAQLRLWAKVPTLAAFPHLDALIARVRRGAADPEGTDQILAALAARAPGDDLAARTLLQALLPGLRNVAKRLGHGRVDDDLEADVLAEAVARIRTYPIERRPRYIAANITWDVFGKLTRQCSRPNPTIAIDASVAETQDPSVEVCTLVTDALDEGKLRAADARLLLDIAVGTDTIRTRAQREGITYDAMNERWRRARNRLRLAAVA